MKKNSNCISLAGFCVIRISYLNKDPTIGHFSDDDDDRQVSSLRLDVCGHRLTLTDLIMQSLLGHDMTSKLTFSVL